MRFNNRLKSAHWDDAKSCWQIVMDDGQAYSTKFLLTAIGLLSTPTLPRYEGVESFDGLSFHTFDAPRDPVDFTGKRVAVVGTGATGVQVISEIANKVGSLTVFQRRPNWCAPLHNSPMTADEMQEIKGKYSEIFDHCRNTPSGFYHNVKPQKTLEEAPEDREVFWDKLYNEAGFGVWLGNYKDMLTDLDANAEFSKFAAKKIRERIEDPEIAEKLIPKDHGFGTRRVPMETKYYEVYNQDNVQLVDIGENPILRVTPKGIKTSSEEYPLDIIIYATGFDAITGAFDKIVIVGEDGLKLKDKWDDGPQTSLGLSISGFPNLITLAGPQSGSVATNFPRGIEEAVEWCSQFLGYLIDNNIDYFRVKKAG